MHELEKEQAEGKISIATRGGVAPTSAEALLNIAPEPSAGRAAEKDVRRCEAEFLNTS
jgi:hypothetical protein